MVTLAVDTLSAGWQAVLYAVAVLLFLVGTIAAVAPARNEGRGRLLSVPLFWIALGLAVAFFVLFWNNLALS